jgi:tRNA G18 (ribose-2'-O)-methylase SpoU
MHHGDVASFVAWCKEENLPIIAIDNTETSTRLETATLPKACVFLFGQEGPGLSAEAIAAADQVL